jgi:ATP/maltotriose-dependent transcriptional regulator MalT/DNA-binding SARP family transcriptional activator
MTNQTKGIAKTTRPSLSGVVARKRLFKRLAAAHSKKVVWISAPAGYGKTTLIADYLDQNDLTSLWYQLDPGEDDVATFFYYMGQSVGVVGDDTPLPTLAPEYRGDLAAFSHRYFRELFSRLTPPFAVVFDNYQEVPAHSKFHDVIRDGLSEVPDGGMVILVSRGEPPASLARFRANQSMEQLTWDDLKLTRDESDELVKKRHPELGEELLEQFFEKTEGWAASLVLMMEHVHRGGIIADAPLGTAPQSVFDYLAGEIFREFGTSVKDFLFKTAFLPQFPAEIVEELTDNHNAEAILMELTSEHHLMTRKQVGNVAIFQYHPLVRDFLLSQASQILSADEQHALRRRGAALMERTGQVEDTVDLLTEAGDWQDLVRIISEQASDLVEQGRAETLERWLEDLPEDALERSPWMLYWLSVCRLPSAPRESRRLCQQAFLLFRSSDTPDVAGLYLAAAGVLEAILHDQDDLTLADPWIDEINQLRSQFPEFPDEKVEARVSCNLFMIIGLRQPYHPDIEDLGERIARISRLQTEPGLRVSVDQKVVVALIWSGQFAQAAEMIEGMRRLAQSPQVSPLLLTTLRYVESQYYMLTGERDRCLEAVRDGLEIAERHGITVWNNSMRIHALAGALAETDLETADQLIDELQGNTGPTTRFDLFLCNYFRAWRAMLGHDVVGAFHKLKASHRLARELGVYYFQVICEISLAQVLLQCGDTGKAVTYLKRVRHNVGRIKNRLLEFTGLMAYSHCALELGRTQSGLNALKAALSLGREKGYSHFLWWQPEILARLCARALKEGIETEYARTLIRKRNLVPEEPPLNIEGWPWSFRIYTLGQFNLLKDDVPHAASGKSQSRPLELLQTLVAFGGSDVTIDRLTDALWPRIDSDYAHKSFNTTLHRLRKTLGSDAALVLKDGRLSLDPRLVWLDTRAFDQVVAEIERRSRGDDGGMTEVVTRDLCEQLFELYQGPFLGEGGEKSWALGLKEKLRVRFLRSLVSIGHFYESQGQWERAADAYERGLLADPVAEGLYRQLMVCFENQGRIAEAMEIFSRCKRALKARLEVEPSPETRQLFDRLAG